MQVDLETNYDKTVSLNSNNLYNKTLTSQTKAVSDGILKSTGHIKVWLLFRLSSPIITQVITKDAVNMCQDFVQGMMTMFDRCGLPTYVCLAVLIFN